MRSLLNVPSVAVFPVIFFWMNINILEIFTAELKTIPLIITTPSTAVTKTTSTLKHTPVTGRPATTSNSSNRTDFVIPFLSSRPTSVFTPPSLIVAPRTVVPVRDFSYGTGRSDNTDVTAASTTTSVEPDTASADNTASTEFYSRSTSSPDVVGTNIETSTFLPSDTRTPYTPWDVFTNSINTVFWRSSTSDSNNIGSVTDFVDNWTSTSASYSATDLPDSSTTTTESYHSAMHALHVRATNYLWWEFLRRDQYDLPDASARLTQTAADLFGSMLNWTYATTRDLDESIANVLRAAYTIPANLLMEMERTNSTCTHLLMIPRMTANWIPYSALGYSNTVTENYILLGLTNQSSAVVSAPENAIGQLFIVHKSLSIQSYAVTGDNYNSPLPGGHENVVLSIRLPNSLLRMLRQIYWPSDPAFVPAAGYGEIKYGTSYNNYVLSRAKAVFRPSYITDLPQRYKRSENLPGYGSVPSWFYPKIFLEVTRENPLHSATLQNLRSDYKNVSVVSRIISLSTTTDNQFQQFFRLPEDGQPINHLLQDSVNITIYGIPSASNSTGISHRYMCGHYDSLSLRWDLEVGCKEFEAEGGVTIRPAISNVTEFTCRCYNFGSFALFRIDVYSVANALSATLRNLRQLYTEGHSARIPEELHLLVLQQLNTVNNTETDQSALQLILDIFQFANVIQSTSISPMQNQNGICNQLMQLRDVVARNIVFRTNDTNETVSASTDDFSIMVTRLSAASRFTGIEAYFESTGIHKVKENGDSDGKGSLGSSIVFPDSLIDHLIRISAQTEVRAWFEVSRNSSIYNATVNSLDSTMTPGSNDSHKKFELASWVTGASFSANIATPDWSDPVTIRAKILQFKTGLNYTCAYWDIDGNNGLGSWSTKGCKKGGVNNSYMTCYCTHLTSFGILVDASGLTELSEATKKILSAGTFAALIISIVALFIVIAIIILTRNLRTNSGIKHLTEKDFVLLNLCIALILTYVTFLAGIDRLEPKELCITTGVFLHWFFLASFAWLIVEGWLLFKTFAVNSLAVPTSQFKLRSVFPCWIVPFAIVSINLIIDKSVYGYGLVKSCWLDSVYASVQFYLTVILPILLTLAWNMIVFLLIIKHLIFTKTTVRSTKGDTDLLTHLRRCVIFSILLGLPWILLLINISNSDSTTSLTMNILVIIFCGLQGVGILIVQAYGTKAILKRMTKSFWRSGHNINAANRKSTSLQTTETSHVKSSKTM